MRTNLRRRLALLAAPLALAAAITVIAPDDAGVSGSNDTVNAGGGGGGKPDNWGWE